MHRHAIGLLAWIVAAGLTLWPTALATESGDPGRVLRARPLVDGATLSGAPDAPVLVSPADGAQAVISSPTLRVGVADPDLDFLDVTFFGRPAEGVPAEDFTVVHLSDTQYYSQSNPATYSAMTQWVLDNREVRNIVFATLSGDIVNVASQIVQWDRADAAMSTLETPILPTLPDGIPYGVSPGNHDMDPNGNPSGTGNYNLYFGIDRFIGRPYYGGSYGGNNDNNYALFRGAGMDFIAVHIEYDLGANPAVIAWADDLLSQYPSHRAIVVSHYIMEIGEQAPFGFQGQAIYDALKDNPNLFLMLAGHRHGEGKRFDEFDGNNVWTLLADYQDEPNQGNGWLRLLEFSPANDEIRVSTYSATLDQFQVDADSEFVLDYEMDAGEPFAELGTTSGVVSGNEAFLVWPSLAANQTYEWYVEVSDGTAVTTSPVWRFTTACVDPAECDDGDSCTIDSCAAGVCVNTDDDLASCDDGDACTIGDVCGDGGCAGIPVSCPPEQSCDPNSGICIPLPQLVTFQQGQAGYAGTIDTFLDSSAPGADNSAATTLVVDRSPERHILLRFEELLAGQGGPIPNQAEILSAELTIQVSNESSGVGASLHRMLQPWNDTDSWNDAGAGIQADDIEATTEADAASSSAVGPHTLDVTESLVAWVNGEPIHGWAWLPPTADNSWQFDSAEGAVPPRLEVTYRFFCQSDSDCDDANPCNGLESCVVGGCAPGTPVDCGTQDCDPVDGSCVDCVTNADCDDGDFCNGIEICAEASRLCLPGAPSNCDDSVNCTDDTCDPALGCLHTESCPAGQVCEPPTGTCESPAQLEAGDVIIAGFQPVGAAEFIELFNTTNREIALDGLELIVRVDNDSDGLVDLDWQLTASTAGKTIQPHGFFLIAEPDVHPGPADVYNDMSIPSSECGAEERAADIEVRIDGVHLDHLLYGRHDGSSPPGEIPPGDLPFDGFPGPVRTEVIRTVTGTPPIESFREGVTQRLSTEALHAGHAVEGFYTDEADLPGDFPAGIWESLHGAVGPYQARDSSFQPVLPPDCIPPEVQGFALIDAALTRLVWTAQAAGTHYDVASGRLSELGLDGGTDGAGCAASGLFGDSWEDPRPTPEIGEGFYYLVRAQTACGSGSYGSESSPGQRAVHACP